MICIELLICNLIKTVNIKLSIYLLEVSCVSLVLYEPRCEKTGLRGFQPGPTETGLYNQRRWLDA